MVNRRNTELLRRQRQNDKEALNMVMHGSYRVDPGPSLLELMFIELEKAPSGFYKNGLFLGFDLVNDWRAGQEKPYHLLKAQVIKCKKDNENPEFTRGVATILAILIEPYGYLGRNDKFESTVNYVLSMEE